MQNPKEYIEERLALLNRPAEKPVFKNEDELVAHMTKATLSKKFRKYAVDDELLPHLQNAIKLNITKNEPIKFVMPFGGYKLWRLDESPEVDWAELFSMMFYAAWLKPIADVYEPGVWFDFSSDDAIVERLNHVPKSDTQVYANSFNETITFLEQYLPKNLKFTLTPVGSRYSGNEFNDEVDSRVKEYMDQNNGELPKLTAEEVAMIDLNVKVTDIEIADSQWREKNKILHDAYMGVSQRRPYTRAEDKILAFTKALPKGVAVGTTKTSIAKFWAGVGALKKREDTYIETVLSPEQITTFSSTWIPIEIQGLQGKNFNKLRIVR